MKAYSLTQKNALHFWCPSGTFVAFIFEIHNNNEVSQK